jgi:hypothetical protein
MDLSPLSSSQALIRVDDSPSAGHSDEIALARSDSGQADFARRSEAVLHQEVIRRSSGGHHFLEELQELHVGHSIDLLFGGANRCEMVVQRLIASEIRHMLHALRFEPVRIESHHAVSLEGGAT